MASWPEWQWNEIQQVGTDFTDIAEVERYDRRMSQFRDLAAEDNAILSKLNLSPGARVVEIGTGTGHFALTAARAGCVVTAFDVSPTMLDYAASRAKVERLENIDFHHAGFLTFEQSASSCDAVVSVAVLHHLPDLWKAIAMQRVYRALKPGGKLLLGDVVFSWDDDQHAAAFEAFINSVPQAMQKEVVRHIAREYSTTDWIMRTILQHAGFRILRADQQSAGFLHYLCEKPA